MPEKTAFSGRHQTLEGNSYIVSLAVTPVQHPGLGLARLWCLYIPLHEAGESFPILPGKPVAQFPEDYPFNRALARWAMRKYKKLSRHRHRAEHWLGGIARRHTKLFVHWQQGILPAMR